jgi:hypothetical protein
MKRNLTLGMIVAVAMLFGTAGYAQRPEENIDPRVHPNLSEAQHLIAKAFDRLSMAQTANEFDMGGHAAHAKELLEQASHEIKVAAMTANLQHH